MNLELQKYIYDQNIYIHRRLQQIQDDVNGLKRRIAILLCYSFIVTLMVLMIFLSVFYE